MAGVSLSYPLASLLILALILATNGAPVDDASKRVWFSGYRTKFSSSGIQPSGKSDINIVMPVFVGSSSRQNLAGTGLWKMTIFGSKENDPDTTLPKLDYQEQVLDEETMNMPIVDGADMLFDVNAKFSIGEMSGCDGGYQYLCVLLSKGDNPDPDFILAAQAQQCLHLSFLTCKQDTGDADKPVWFSSYRIAFSPSAGDATERSLFGVKFTTEIGGSSRQNLAGTGLWKMTIFGSKEDDPDTTLPKLDYQEQVLDQQLTDLPIENGGGLVFDVDAQFDYGKMGGCDGDYKYFCVLFTKGDNPNPDFQFLSEYRQCTALTLSCKPGVTDEPVWFSSQRVLFSPSAGDATERSPFGVRFTAEIGGSSRQNLAGTGLWKMTIFGSKEDDPDTTLPKLDYQEQVLDQQLTDLPIENGGGLVFDVDAQFDYGKMGGCDGDYKYFCVLFTKGDNPNPDFQFLTEYRQCTALTLSCKPVLTDDQLPISFSKYNLWIGSNGFRPTGKSHINIAVQAPVDESSRQNLAGTGLWKMTIFGSKEDNPDTALSKLDYQEQILGQELQNMPVTDGAMLVFDVDGEFELGKMGGCDGEYKYFCVLFTKGDNPDPEFEFATEYRGCTDLGFTCIKKISQQSPVKDSDKAVRFYPIHLLVSLSGVNQDGRSPVGITLRAEVGDTSRKNLAGTGLWKMSIFGSKEDDPATTLPVIDYQKQILDQNDQGLSIEYGHDLNFFVDAQFELRHMGGCDGDYRYLCVIFTKGDNPDPDFDLGTAYRQCVNLNFPCQAAPTDADKPVRASSYGLSFGSKSFKPTGKSEMYIKLTAGIHETSRQNLAGTGLWKMTIFASKEDNPATTLPVLDYQEQVLSQQLADLPIENGGDLVFDLNPQFELSKMGGCDGDYKYFCILLNKGDSSDPDFNFETPYGQCKEMGFTCSTPSNEPAPVWFSNYGLNVGAKVIRSTGLSDMTIKLTAVVGESSLKNLAGTGLWKMTVFGSKEDNPDTTLPKLDYQEQVLDEETMNMPIVNGANMLFDVDAKFSLGEMSGCDGGYKYFCVLLEKGDSPEPDFTLAAGYRTCTDLGLVCS